MYYFTFVIFYIFMIYLILVEQNMPLLKLLNQTFIGRLICFKYINEKIVMRRELCDIIIDNAMNESLSSCKPLT